MRIKLDENIPVSAGQRLAALGFDVDTVLAEGLNRKTDSEVWAAAQAEGRLLVTQDLDFSDARAFPAGTHAGLFIVRLPDSEQRRLGDYPRRVVQWPRRQLLATLSRDRDAEQAPGAATAGLRTNTHFGGT